jgi:activating signal cointegrator complex subunit 3
MPFEEMEPLASSCRDQALRDCLAFGIGIHHAGLDAHDRNIVEDLFVKGKIQVLCCTATLAWGVNFPAHLVVVKGTEFFDAKQGRYVDFPVTDVLQMMGRAGRPQFDDSGVACILVHEPKKNFFKKFLHEPFPVESSLKGVLPDHLNAEIAAGTIKTKAQAIDYLTWTFFFRRLVVNPSYYQLEGMQANDIFEYLDSVVRKTFNQLSQAKCIEVSEEGTCVNVQPSALGYIGSYYYLSHASIHLFHQVFSGEGPMFDRAALEGDIASLCRLATQAMEFSELPVRHNEDLLNFELSRLLPWGARDEISNVMDMEKSNTKAYLLLQAYFAHTPLPISDYINDTKAVMDQIMRVVNAMIDVAAFFRQTDAVLGLIRVAQMIVQGVLCSDRIFREEERADLDDEFLELAAEAEFSQIPHFNRGNQSQHSDPNQNFLNRCRIL